MLTAENIKTIALGLGADQCGIANSKRFDDAPNGLHRRDIYSRCKSIVVFIKQMPPEVINAENPVVYTHTANLLYDALDKIGLNLCFALEKQGIHAVPVPTDVPYLHWEPKKMHGMGILSMRHGEPAVMQGILDA